MKATDKQVSGQGKKRAPPTPRFFMVPAAVAARHDLSGNAKVVYGVVANEAQFNSGSIGFRRLMRLAGISRDTLSRALHSLEAKGLVIIRRSGHGPIRRRNTYEIGGPETGPVQNSDRERSRNQTASGPETGPRIRTRTEEPPSMGARPKARVAFTRGAFTVPPDLLARWEGLYGPLGVDVGRELAKAAEWHAACLEQGRKPGGGKPWTPRGLRAGLASWLNRAAERLADSRRQGKRKGPRGTYTAAPRSGEDYDADVHRFDQEQRDER